MIGIFVVERIVRDAGHVDRARDKELDEIVALKRLHRELLGSEEMIARFRQEVRLARRVEL